MSRASPKAAIGTRGETAADLLDLGESEFVAPGGRQCSTR
jgi:hypothetical protein